MSKEEGLVINELPIRDDIRQTFLQSWFHLSFPCLFVFLWAATPFEDRVSNCSVATRPQSNHCPSNRPLKIDSREKDRNHWFIWKKRTNLLMTMLKLIGR